MSDRKNVSGTEAEVEFCPLGTDSGSEQPGTQSTGEQRYQQANRETKQLELLDHNTFPD